MDKKFLFNIGFIFFYLLSISTDTLEALFFGYPKKSLNDFLDTLKEKKENMKISSNYDRIHHLHFHYYPVPPVISFLIEREPPDTLNRDEFKIIKKNPRDKDSLKIHHLTVDDQIDLSAFKKEFSHTDINQLNKESDLQSIRNNYNYRNQYDFNKIFFHLLPIKHEIVINQPISTTIKNDDINNNNNDINNNKLNPLINFFQYLNRIKNLHISFK